MPAMQPDRWAIEVASRTISVHPLTEPGEPGPSARSRIQIRLWLDEVYAVVPDGTKQYAQGDGETRQWRPPLTRGARVYHGGDLIAELG